jgi:hypothetical protein
MDILCSSRAALWNNFEAIAQIELNECGIKMALIG